VRVTGEELRDPPAGELVRARPERLREGAVRPDHAAAVVRDEDHVLQAVERRLPLGAGALEELGRRAQAPRGPVPGGVQVARDHGDGADDARLHRPARHHRGGDPGRVEPHREGVADDQRGDGAGRHDGDLAGPREHRRRPHDAYEDGVADRVRGIAVEDHHRDREHDDEPGLDPRPADERGEERLAREEGRVDAVGGEEERADDERRPRRGPLHEQVAREVDRDEDGDDEPAQPEQPLKPLGELSLIDVVRPRRSRAVHLGEQPSPTPGRGV
jgi:hypothetical protein